ncbi:MAG: hypothetical protein E7062_08960 [Spirochaetaceae bacterium]|nr:hypothetical protein [Spirochaetaceae bacterium]
MEQQKNLHKTRFFSVITNFFILCSFLFLCVSCKESNQVVLWTDRQEFVSYAELFNASQENYKVIVIYKNNPSEAFPPAKDELTPDVVVGPWLKNEKTRKNFTSLNHLFSEMQINPAALYPQLLTAGNIDDKQYLLPISFNLPTIVFSKSTKKNTQDNYLISLEEIKNNSKEMNKKNKSKIYTSMGFAPRWDAEFLYTVSKIKGVEFKETKEGISWDKAKLEETVQFLRQWTLENNTSSKDEEDYAFKYLYTTEIAQINQNLCHLAFIPSNDFFTLSPEKLLNVDYRWLHEDSKIPVLDKIISLGMYKKAKNSRGAEAFIVWLLKESTQKLLLERAEEMKLNISTFGIAGGFSSLRKVNEQIFPIYYPILMQNLPIADYLSIPQILPQRWDSLKTRVIQPYLLDATNTEKEHPSQSLEEMLANWQKQYF